MSDSETCSNRLQLDLMLILENFLCELNSHIIIWPFRLNITFVWLQKLNPGYEICIISYQVNLYSEVSAMFNSLMPSLNSRSLPFVVFLGGFPSRCQNLSSGAIRPGGPLVFPTKLFFSKMFLGFFFRGGGVWGAPRPHPGVARGRKTIHFFLWPWHVTG